MNSIQFFSDFSPEMHESGRGMIDVTAGYYGSFDDLTTRLLVHI